MRIALAVVVVAGIGCKKDSSPSAPPGSPTAPASTKDQDELWALAPPNAKIGFVASPRGVEKVENAWLAVTALIAVAPEMAPAKAELDKALAKIGATGGKLSDLGLTHDKGFAFFVTGEKAGMIVLPVVDRDKFLATVHGTKGTDTDTLEDGTCKTIDSRYICAKPAGLLDQVGKDRGLAAKLKPVGTRGDLEFVGEKLEDGKTGPAIAVVAQLDRGAFVVRGAVVGGLPPEIRMMSSAMKPRADVDTTAGFLMFDARAALAAAPKPPVPVVAGVTLADLMNSVDGTLTMAVPAGELEVDVRIPVKDPGPASKLVEHCTDLRPLAMVGATSTDGVCHVAVPQTKLELDAWVDGKELRIGKKGGSGSGKSAPMSAFGAEIAKGEWTFAFFGHGTIFGLGDYLPLASIPMNAETALGLRAMGLVNEMGAGVRIDGDTLRFVFGVRTAWSNPDDVVDAVLAISPDDVISGKASERAKSIADGHASSPFASDVHAGPGGMIGMTAPIGILAAVAIPAFMDYMKKSKKTEAEVMLRNVTNKAKAAYIEKAEFPKGTAPLTPATDCCMGPNGKCAVDAKGWQDPIWQALDFRIDEPTLYRYSYESDGKEFTVKAVGDLDCDGVPGTWEAHGRIVNGNVEVSIDKPPRGTY